MKDEKSEMKIITVIPIDRGIFKDNLSYFSKSEITIGSLITVPVNKRLVSGLVTQVQNASQIKSSLKSQDFVLRKISPQNSQNFFLPEFIEASKITADWFIAHVGQIIKASTPKVILSQPQLIRQEIKPILDKKTNSNTAKADICIFQESDQERLAYYKSLVRESFARQASIFFCLPTIPHINRTVPLIEKGIEQYTIILHSKLSNKEIESRWQKALETEHPVLIIATPLFLSLPRTDIKTIIVDKENSSAYKTLVRPFIDMRFLAETLARQRKIKLIFGDIVLRTETIFRQGKGELVSQTPLKYRSFSEARQTLIDLKTHSDLGKKEVNLLDPELKAVIKKSIAKNERIFLYTTRRGNAGLTICNDCGSIIACPKCQSPLVIHQTLDKKSYFACHKCDTEQAIKDKCPDCGSWRLAMLAGGINKVAEELKTEFPNLNLFIISSDTTSTTKKVLTTMAKFYNTPGSVLLGTEMSLPYLSEPIENSAIVSIDSLFTIPDFRISEKIFGHLIKIREISTKRFLIQTRNPDEKVLNYCLKGNLLDFYRDEIEERKHFNYPPFSILIKISKEGPEKEIQAALENLAEELKIYSPKIYSSLAKTKNTAKINLLIKLPVDNWLNPELLSILKNLPPAFIVTVDPEEIL